MAWWYSNKTLFTKMAPIWIWHAGRSVWQSLTRHSLPESVILAVSSSHPTFRISNSPPLIQVLEMANLRVYVISVSSARNLPSVHSLISFMSALTLSQTNFPWHPI
jgi:hypothetical protein